MEKRFYISSSEISGFARACIGSGNEPLGVIGSLIVQDPEFYFNYLREKYYDIHASNIWNFYPDLTFKEFNDTVRAAIVNYIRSFYPESMRGGVLS